MDITEFLDYHQWADDMVFDSLKQVSDNDFVAKTDELRSIRELVEHYLSSYDYLIYSGDELKERASIIANMSIEYLKDEIHKSHKKFREKVLNFDGTQTLEMMEGKSAEMDRDNYILLFLDHLTYHRGQITHSIKMKGYKGVNTDYYDFLEKDKYADRP